MRTLLLLRHARASAAPGAPDLARPLDDRGRRDAHALGRELARRGTVLDAVVCSPAARALETARLVLESAGLPASLRRTDARIYEATAGMLLRVARELPADAATVLLVGHNPGLEELVLRVAPEGALGMAPCTLGALTLDVDDWADAPGAVSVAWRWVPGLE